MPKEEYQIHEDVKVIEIFDQRWYQITDGKKQYDIPGTTTYLEAYPKGYNYTQWLKSNGFNADILFERAGIFGSNCASGYQRCE